MFKQYTRSVEQISNLLWWGKFSNCCAITPEYKLDVNLKRSNVKWHFFQSVMSQKEHGTCTKPLSKNLRWDVDWATADKICCFNRHFAEYSGYFTTTEFMKETGKDGPITFYDPINSKPLFIAPQGRSWREFIRESQDHGWPSFRDEEVVWENVRCLRNGETVTLDGIHLGHNLPDGSGNRYCINLVSVAGQPPK